MDAKRITLNFILSPINISAVLTSKIETKDVDPIYILLYGIFNTLIVSGFIFLLLERFYDTNTAFLSIGLYLTITFLLGFILGYVDQIFEMY